MFKEFLIYTVICDSCGIDSNSECDYSGWEDKDYALEVALESSYVEVDDKHYCPACYEYDDNDGLVIRNKPESEVTE